MLIFTGIQLTLVSWMTIRMIKSDNINRPRGRQNVLVTMTGWFLAIIGLIVSSVYFKQLKFNVRFQTDSVKRSFHFKTLSFYAGL